LETTYSFEIQTYSSAGYVIDEKSDQMTIQMLSTNPITSASTVPLSLVVGQNTTYSFNIVSPTDLHDGDIVTITFPAQLSMPIRSTF